MRAGASYILKIAALSALALCLAQGAFAQLNQNCTVSVLNRTVQVNADGSWVLPNIPANFGQVKARATCVQNGLTTFGESAFFTVPANGAVNLPQIVLGNTNPIPVSLAITPVNPPLTAAGQTIQLIVTATYPDGSTRNVSAASAGTNYTTSNAAIASITSDGLVTAVASGTVVIQSTNDGASGIISVPVVLGGDSVGGLPVSWIIANHLNQNDPTLALEDPDRDGLTNLQEYQGGTDPNNPDTDGDGLSDGDEVNTYHTNPLLADTDGDLIPDGVEVQTGSNPLDRNSYDLKKATASSIVKPPAFVLSTSAVTPNVSQQLSWTVTLIDGKTTLDLTDDPRTNYSSSNVQVCNFGAQHGQVFAGSVGSCVITISQNTLSVTASGTVQSFSPGEVSTLNISGAVAVDVAGSFAYVAAGANGLTIVDVNDRTRPRTRGTLSGIGDAEAIRVSGPYAFIADANGFLRVVHVQNPDAPLLATSLPFTGKPIALALHTNLLAVAAQSGGVYLVDITSPTAPAVIATLTTSASAIGVDFDTQRGLAAVAMGSAGVQMVDISIPRSPFLRGLLPGGNVRRVLLRYPAVLLADTQRSVTAVNITNPDQPVLSSSIASNLGGAPVDIASFIGVAITADTSFGRAIPVIDISNPVQPNALTFWTPQNAGFGSSIAMDASFGYLIMSTNSTLRIYQYRQIVDPPGTPPTIQITSPITGTTVIQGSTLTATANAIDDVGVAGVTFFQNGQPAFTTTQPPYQYALTVPSTGSTLTIGAVATDFAGDTGTAPAVTLNVIPDLLTTARGRVVDTQSNPVSGATVSALALTAFTASDGTFALPGLPTIQGPIKVTGTAVVNGTAMGGVSASVAPVMGGVTNIGDLKIAPIPVITAVAPKTILGGTTATLTVTGTNLSGSMFALALSNSSSATSINSVSINAAGTSASLSITIAASVSAYCSVVATNAAGPSSSIPVIGFLPTVSSFNTFSIPGSNANDDPDNDGLTNAQEITQGTDPLNADTDGDGWPDGLEVLLGSNPLDPKSIPTPKPGGGYLSSPIMSFLNKANPSTQVTGSTQYVSSLTFSILNNLNPSIGIPGSTQSVSSPIFSMLNLHNPATGLAGTKQFVSSPTFSMLNNLNPSIGIAGSTQYVSSRVFSILNGISPAPLTPTQRFVNGRVFSISNTVGGGTAPLISALSARETIAARVAQPWLFLSGALGFDSDMDGVSDEDEIRLGTNPLDRDTDHDGYPDGLEIALGSDPLDPKSVPDVNSPGFTISPAFSIRN